MKNNYLVRLSTTQSLNIYSINPTYPISPAFNTSLSNALADLIYQLSPVAPLINKFTGMSINDNNLLGLISDTNQFWLFNITSATSLITGGNGLPTALLDI